MTIMKRISLAFLLIVFCFLFISTIVAEAAPVGKITRIEGRVDVLKAGQRSVMNVSLGDSVDVGDIYRAKTNSRAEITFINKNILRIAPATRVQVSQYSDEGNRSNQVMKLDRGKVQAVSGEEFVKKVSSFAEGNKFEVHTPNAVAGIRGSGMTVGFAQMVTGLFFETGKGYFYNPSAPGRVVNVTAGFVSFVVGTGGIPSRPVQGNVSYVGGSGSSSPQAENTTASTGTGNSNLNVQLTSLTSSVATTTLFTPPPVIPNVFVGVVPSLSGTYNDPFETVNVSLNNVKFYGPTATGTPQSWKADSVTGTYESIRNSPGTNFKGMALSGSGMTANLIITSDLDTGLMSGNWTANIASGNAPTGVGTCTTPFTFSGTAAGTWNGTIVGNTETGVINGNASGVAPSVLTQDPIAAPNILVGSLPVLSGTLGSPNMFVELTNVKFYGPSATAPQVWLGAVTGSFDPASPLSARLNTPVTLTSGANVATFTLNGVNGTAWTGSVTSGSAPSGVGTYPSPIVFSGHSTGTVGASSISGTASGTAK